uniref:Uncharacterized protein n=1 Tax=Arundo donax TaxID=35708 RepID=A0A0A9CFZ1_ARUDO
MLPQFYKQKKTPEFLSLFINLSNMKFHLASSLQKPLGPFR